MESVCASVYPGNLTDRTVFRDFVETNHVQGGIIITDRGFQYGPAKQVFLDDPDLHFLIPLERGSKMIREYNILCTDRTLDNRPAVAGRKVGCMMAGSSMDTGTRTGLSLKRKRGCRSTGTTTHPNSNPGGR
ncbi:MAG: transposase, partial [Candidatus Methanomethylophilaceae archaeon]|nr:transposase [Candidatus Methanomethylophilaceae archaeon]